MEPLTPQEAAQIMREQAISLLDLCEKFALLRGGGLNQAQLAEWCEVLMQQFAEFKWSMADLMDAIPESANFRVYRYSDEDMAPPTRDIVPFAYEHPPFDAEYFMRKRPFE